MKLYVHEFGFWRDEDTENAPPKVRKRPRGKADVRDRNRLGMYRLLEAIQGGGEAVMGVYIYLK
jgi:hypothetical protein